MVIIIKIKNKQVVEEILPPVFNWIENENEMLIQHYVLIFVICVFVYCNSDITPCLDWLACASIDSPDCFRMFVSE